jgi:ABC-type uncharacterized transport system involved in gliding motility auxiliary subunit
VIVANNIRRWFDVLLPLLATATLVGALNQWTMRHPSRLDLTSGKVYSISAETVGVLRSLKSPITITFFHDTRSRAMQDARYLLEQYAAVTPHITVDSYDPMLEPAAAERLDVQFAGTAVFESGVRRIAINEPGEVAFTNALIRVTSDAVGRICFTDGHVEMNPFSLQSHDHFEDGGGAGHSHASGGEPLSLHERHGFGMAKNALETLGYAVEQRVLTKPGVLSDCTVVVVASPQAAFSEMEVNILREFISAGGPALLMLEPGIQAGLDAVLNDFGIAINRASVRDPKRHYWTDPGTPAVTNYARHKITRQLALSFFPGAAELVPVPSGVPAGVVITPLVETSDMALLSDATDEPRARTLVLEAIRPTDSAKQQARQHVIVSGDGDFASNSFYGALGNGQLFLNAVNHLAAQDQLIDIAPREYVTAELRMSNDQLRATFILTTVIGPLSMLVLGVWIWIRRRR